HGSPDRSKDQDEALEAPPAAPASVQQAPSPADSSAFPGDAVRHPSPMPHASPHAGRFMQTDMPRLNHRQREMWPRIEQVGSISRQEYQQMVGENISMRTAQYDLQLFVQMGLVRKEGRGPAQRYVVVPGRPFSG
ncbi:hypothetical protein V6C07_11610, partial [Desulfovibrio sp. 1214_IL3152]